MYAGSRNPTDHDHIKQAASNSEAQLRVLEKNANIAVIEWHRNSGDFWWSENFHKVLQLKGDALRPSLAGFLSFIHPNDQEKIQGLLEHLLEHKNNIRILTHILTESGEEIPILFYMEYVEDGDMFLGYVQDRRQDLDEQADLVDTLFKYRAVMAGAGEAILLVNQFGMILEGNQRASEMLEIRENELANMDIAKLHPPSELQKMMGHYQNMLWGETKYEETEIIGKQGKITPVQISGRATNIEHQQVLVLVLHDITLQKMAQEELEVSEKKYRSLVDEAREAIILLDGNGHILSVNPRLSELTKISREELLKRSFDDITDFDMDISPIHIMQSTTMRDAMHTEGYLKGSNGSLLPTGFNVAKFDQEGESRFIVTAYDLAPVRQGEEERMALQRQLFQSQKQEIMGQLAGSLAHDFNNLLSPILLISEVLAEESKDEFFKGNLHKITTAAYQARRLVARILDYARPRESEFQVIDLKHEVAEIVELFKASIPHTIQIKLDLPEVSYRTHADPDQIHQLIMNLGTNAAQAIGDQHGTISFQLEDLMIEESNPLINRFEIPEGHYVRLLCQDSGPGFPEGQLDEIFEPFFTTKAQTDGSGLGLTIVSRIMDIHDGCLEAYNTEYGACIELYFPLIDGT